jgi:hypothetical protein
MNKKLNHLVKNYAHAIMLLFMGIFYFRLILTHGINSYEILKNVILGKMALKPITITLFEMTLFDAFYVVFPLLVSYLIYKKITLFGFFLGFILQWIIFLNTNPYPLTQDNKLTIMELIPKKYRPEIQFSLDELKKSSMHEMHVKFPIIIKPSVCSGRRKNVTIVKTQQALDKYFKENKNTANYMVQNYLSDEYDIEIGVLWEKMPWEKEGTIIEINEQPKFKKNKDDHDDQDEQDALNKMNEKVKTFNYLINDDLNKLFNDISKNIKGFNAGRYDILIKSLKGFKNGDFKILEVNGIWGGQATMHEDPLIYINWFLKRFVIGLGNIVTLQGYSPMNLLMVMFKSYARHLWCDPASMFSLYI